MANLYCSTLSPIYTAEDSRSFAVANYPTTYLRSRKPLWNPSNIPENLSDGEHAEMLAYLVDEEKDIYIGVLDLAA